MTNEELEDARCEALMKLAVAVQVYQASMKAGNQDRTHETSEWLRSLIGDYVALTEERDDTIVKTQPQASRKSLLQRIIFFAALLVRSGRLRTTRAIATIEASEMLGGLGTESRPDQTEST